jgi:hypothetical protein
MMLLTRFPPIEEAIDDTYLFVSGWTGSVRSKNSMQVGIGVLGLHFAPMWPFRPILSRGIPCIPWREIRCIQAQSDRVRGLVRDSAFEITSLDYRFTVRGAAGRAIERKVAAISPAPPS